MPEFNVNILIKHEIMPSVSQKLCHIVICNWTEAMVGVVVCYIANY
jgi:hypothetical protein